VLVVAIVFGVLVCAAIAAFGLLVVGAVAFADTSEDDVAPAIVENVARIRLPAGARDLRSQLDGFQDRFIWVRFRLAEQELGTFERSLGCRLGAATPTPPQVPNVSRPAWWSDAKVSRSCHASGPGYDQTVIVDLGTAPELLVFVVVFET